jgi:hypothetical protein
LVRSVFKNGLSAAAMGIIILYLHPILLTIIGSGAVSKIIVLVITIIIGLCSFVAFGILLKSEELIDASGTIIEKLKKRFFKKKEKFLKK